MISSLQPSFPSSAPVLNATIAPAATAPTVVRATPTGASVAAVASSAQITAAGQGNARKILREFDGSAAIESAKQEASKMVASYQSELHLPLPTYPVFSDFADASSYAQSIVRSAQDAWQTGSHATLATDSALTSDSAAGSATATSHVSVQNAAPDSNLLSPAVKALLAVALPAALLRVVV